MAALIIFHKGQAILKEELVSALSIGSSTNNDITLPELPAAHHAKIEFNNEEIILIDLVGQIFVNGEKILGSVKLNDDDLIDIGPYRFHFLAKSSETSSFKKNGKTVTIGLKKIPDGYSDVIPTIQFLKPFEKRKKQVRLILGRGLGCDINIDHDYVSARHAEIYVERGKYYIRDLNSRNGTYVNDFSVDKQALPDRGMIRLGKLPISYQIEYPTEETEAIEGYPLPGPRANSPVRLLIGKSAPFQQTLDVIKKAASTDDPVLLIGETGVGKDLFAHYLHHYHKKRSKKPFVIVNCATIPNTLAESQLFGHKRGAFTGALTDHKGFFQQADTGTLFLDEIGELPIEIQASLLRIIEDGIIKPMGSEHDIETDVRIVAATNRDLKKAQLYGKFRKDLYERFDWFIEIPSLRHRAEDIPTIVKYFLKTHSPTPISIDKNTLRHLQSLQWKGNVRSLNRVVRRAITNALACGSSIVTAVDFGLTESEENYRNGDATKILREKRTHLPDLLYLHKGNISRVARELDLARLTVRKWCKEDGIAIEGYRDS